MGLLYISNILSMYVFMGDFSKTINLKKKKKKVASRLCVSFSWFKETGGLHSVRRSWVPTSINKNGK